MHFSPSFTVILSFSLAALASAAAVDRRAAFTKQNGLDAQALNEKFATLTADSPCTDGESACVNGDFAQCSGGSLQVTPCAGGLTCTALPLVNSPGTSVTCDTQADADARISNTGATARKRDLERRAAFTKQNGLDAQALNAKFATLAANSPCTDGESACVNGDFAQCSGGSFQVTPCAGGLTCVALPLVNSPGTSVTCDTQADANTRIANTGATTTGSKRSPSSPNHRRQATPTAPPACAASGSGSSKRSPSDRVIKRIAQSDLGAVAQSWQDLCNASGGDITTGNPCVQLAGTDGINSLLANADACAQQDNADAMVDFAKSAGVTNKDALIANAVAYRKHPRNALNINGVVPSTLFCQKAPKNAELNGVVNAQLDGVDPGLFGSPSAGIIAFGGAGTCPFGQTADVSTCTCS